MSHGVHSLDYPDARYFAVEMNMVTGAHQLLNRRSEPYSKCIERCQSLGRIGDASKHRHLFLAHKDGGKDE